MYAFQVISYTLHLTPTVTLACKPYKYGGPQDSRRPQLSPCIVSLTLLVAALLRQRFLTLPPVCMPTALGVVQHSNTVRVAASAPTTYLGNSMSNSGSTGSAPGSRLSLHLGRFVVTRSVPSWHERRYGRSPVWSSFLQLDNGEEALRHARWVDAVVIVVINYHPSADPCTTSSSTSVPNIICGKSRTLLGIRRFYICLTKQTSLARCRQDVGGAAL